MVAPARADREYLVLGGAEAHRQRVAASLAVEYGFRYIDGKVPRPLTPSPFAHFERTDSMVD